MLKLFATLARGRAAAAVEAVADREALLLLDQQVRDATAALARAKRALAHAMAQDDEDGKRLAECAARCADLEARAGQALAADRLDLATEAAEVVARLEADLAGGRQARAAFAAGITRLRRVTGEASARLAAVEQGRRVARVAEAVRRLRQDPAGSSCVPEATLAEAEATLARLRARQTEDAAAADALDGLDRERGPADLAERLGNAGFGAPARPTAATVLARLRAASNA
jgi:phage shock protein A